MNSQKRLRNKEHCLATWLLVTVCDLLSLCSWGTSTNMYYKLWSKLRVYIRKKPKMWNRRFIQSKQLVELDPSWIGYLQILCNSASIRRWRRAQTLNRRNYQQHKSTHLYMISIISSTEWAEFSLEAASKMQWRSAQFIFRRQAPNSIFRWRWWPIATHSNWFKKIKVLCSFIVRSTDYGLLIFCIYVQRTTV